MLKEGRCERKADIRKEGVGVGEWGIEVHRRREKAGGIAQTASTAGLEMEMGPGLETGQTVDNGCVTGGEHRRERRAW